MVLFYSIVEVAIFSFVLSVLYRQSYNLLFFYLKKPLLWILFVGFLPLLWFSLGVIFHLSPTVVWWSSIVALCLNIPSKNNLTKKNWWNLLTSLRKYRTLFKKVGMVKFASR